MTLYVDSHGSGTSLVMLHGWGMHGGIWGRAVSQLAQQFQVHCVDLPGHGKSGGLLQYNLDAIVDKLTEQFSGPLTVCGWSLGGQIALRWAQQYPAQVKNMVLVASTPCFVQREGWSCAMAPEPFQEFTDLLLQNHAQALHRFVALQVRGSERERQLLTDMRVSMLSRSQPDIRALSAGLEILRDTDLRNHLGRIAQRSLVISGGRDTLTPPAASVYLAETLADACLVKINGAAHAPFLSHPDIFVEHIKRFFI